MAHEKWTRPNWVVEHRTWEDWAGIALGILIVLSPWIALPSSERGVPFLPVAIGLLVTLLAQLELVALRRWHEIAELACGVTLVASPFILGYAKTGQLRYWHFALGAGVTLLALLALWQDWNLSDDELSKHGQ
jgi:hypothetical protein